MTKDQKLRKKQLERKLRELKDQEERDIAQVHYPEFRDKYEGRYFKAQNGYGRDEKWLLYTKVTKIELEDVYDTSGNGMTSHYKGWNFQTDSNGEVRIAADNFGYVHLLGDEISEQMFNDAWDKMIVNVTSLKTLGRDRK